jgi:hypothetical protein
MLWAGVADVEGYVAGNLRGAADEEAEVEDLEGWWSRGWDSERNGEEGEESCCAE